MNRYMMLTVQELLYDADYARIGILYGADYAVNVI
jgi:hypothetical protein